MHIENIFVCPKCDHAEPAAVKPRYCKECGYSFIENDFSKYYNPITLTEQFTKLKDVEGLRDAVLDLPLEKAISILEDAKSIVETIGGRKDRTMDIRPLVECAIRIGGIAKAYDDFLRAGGRHIPSLYTNNDNSEVSDESSKASGSTGEVTAGTQGSSGAGMEHVFQDAGADRSS